MAKVAQAALLTALATGSPAHEFLGQLVWTGAGPREIGPLLTLLAAGRISHPAYAAYARYLGLVWALNQAERQSDRVLADDARQLRLKIAQKEVEIQTLRARRRVLEAKLAQLRR